MVIRTSSVVAASDYEVQNKLMKKAKDGKLNVVE